jgi:hypothetical protein
MSGFDGLVGDAEHRVLVAAEGNWASMLAQIPFQSLEVGKRALRLHKSQLHQRAGCVVDEYQQRAGRCSIFKPAMI